MSILSVLIGILLFSLLIFVHELGHFLTAKASGVQVNEFAIFMGPAIFKKKVGETLYTIRCIPFGGYCAMEGEDEDSDNPRAFGRAAWWKRLLILAAGSIMNLLAGVLLLAVLYAPQKEFSVPVIHSFEDFCTLDGAEGLQVGDEFLEIDGEKVYVAGDFSMLLSLSGGETHDLVVRRNGEKVFLEDFRMETHAVTNGDGTTVQRYGLTFAAQAGNPAFTLGYIAKSSVNMVRMVRLSLEMLFTGQAGLKDMGGPVMIVDMMAQMTDQASSAAVAMQDLLWFCAMIAINLAVMNLLPIPALDGGRIFCLLVVTAIEAVTHKKVNPKYEAYIHGIGMILLLLLMAVILFKDVFVIIKR